MTNQELFTISRNHLLTQGVKALSVEQNSYGGYSCLYRGPNGTKCAIGCHIPDEKYDRSFEGLPVRAYRVREAAGITSEQEELAVALQNTHDYNEPSEWSRLLEHVAANFNLTIEPVVRRA